MPEHGDTVTLLDRIDLGFGGALHLTACARTNSWRVVRPSVVVRGPLERGRFCSRVGVRCAAGSDDAAAGDRSKPGPSFEAGPAALREKPS